MNATHNTLITIQARNLQPGDMINGFDKVFLVSLGNISAHVRSLCNDVYYGLHDTVRISPRPSNKAVFNAGPSRETLNHIPRTDTLIEHICYIRDADDAVQAFANDL